VDLRVRGNCCPLFFICAAWGIFNFQKFHDKNDLRTFLAHSSYKGYYWSKELFIEHFRLVSLPWKIFQNFPTKILKPPVWLDRSWQKQERIWNLENCLFLIPRIPSGVSSNSIRPRTRLRARTYNRTAVYVYGWCTHVLEHRTLTTFCVWKYICIL
jgi:hypothetical protein